MLAELLALFAAAGDPAKPAPANTPSHTVSGVVVQGQPPGTIDKAPDAVTRSVGGEDEALSDYVAVWPKGAYAAGRDGRVTLSCLIDVHGLAEWCRVAAESPPGQGFGKAALELKPTFKLKPAQGPNGPVAKVMSINVGFRQPDFQFDQAELARQMWFINHTPGASLTPMDLPYSHNRLAMRSVTMVDNPVWVAAASFDDLVHAIPAKAAGAEGYAAAHCEVVRTGPAAGALKGCQVIKEEPKGRDFGKAALTLAARFRLAPQALPNAPTGAPLWVDVPVRFPAAAELADRSVKAPVWLTSVDLATAGPSFFPLKALEGGLRSGRGTARCTVEPDGTLGGCVPDSAQPEGMGFSEAVVRLAPMMRLNLWTADGQPVLGGVVRFPLQLTLPGSEAGGR